MSRIINISVTFFVTLVFLHTSVFIGGGRGPFALNEEYWSCKCKDLADGPVDSAFPPVQEYHRPSLKVAGFDAKPSQISEIDHLEMCAGLAAVVPKGGVCKKKLPLRYMSMLLANALVIHESLPVILLKTDPPHSEILADREILLPAGQISPLFRPPRA